MKYNNREVNNLSYGEVITISHLPNSGDCVVQCLNNDLDVVIEVTVGQFLAVIGCLDLGYNYEKNSNEYATIVQVCLNDELDEDSQSNVGAIGILRATEDVRFSKITNRLRKYHRLRIDTTNVGSDSEVIDVEAELIQKLKELVDYTTEAKYARFENEADKWTLKGFKQELFGRGEYDRVFCPSGTKNYKFSVEWSNKNILVDVTPFSITLSLGEIGTTFQKKLQLNIFEETGVEYGRAIEFLNVWQDDFGGKDFEDLQDEELECLCKIDEGSVYNIPSIPTH